LTGQYHAHRMCLSIDALRPEQAMIPPLAAEYGCLALPKQTHHSPNQ